VGQDGALAFDSSSNTDAQVGAEYRVQYEQHRCAGGCRVPGTVRATQMRRWVPSTGYSTHARTHIPSSRHDADAGRGGRGEIEMGIVGGVNRSSLHCRCRLAKFRGLMYRGKHSALIGLEIPIACIFIVGAYKKRVSRPITALYLPPYIKPRIFAKRQCKVQWFTPPRSGAGLTSRGWRV